ncbi:ATP-binding protein [Salinisphaera sp. LB1]|uniref:HAMP domain-containing sensor histidine kinase n=1 Tax=Salinisphaera sp. LB1 TaxID=2183911 RepID=UPI000D70657C|nr:ATP-binding protein [Salinisphaera sp. LB1]AWN16485.1 Putative sensor-like histidine kinase YfhK [Salinisphaera sp. LB1]
MPRGDSHNETSARRRLLGVLLRPRSINGLVLASFAVVATPLMVAIVASVVYVNQLNAQSERLVMQGVAVTRDSKRLNSLLISMERSARQYRVLGQADLVDRFRSQAQAFEGELKSLARLHLDTVPSWNLSSLREQVAGLAQRLGTGDKQTDQVISTLNTIRHSTDAIADQGARFVDQELDHLQRTARHARLFLLVCVFALIPAAVALGLFLTFVIARPLRQILDAVSHLGTGDFSRPVSIVAPAAELDRLGERLDWMRQRLATLDEEKQQFIRHMSHELKTPLASIREGTELLADGSVGVLSEAQREVATILQSNSQDLAALIDNLLNSATWQQQRARLEYTEFDLAALIERMVERQKLAIEARDLRVDRPRSPVILSADRDRLHLIVDNLLANAVKFSPMGGTIRIEVEYGPTEGTDLYVSDDGPGVATTERERIFEAFVRGSSTPGGKSAVKGTGIGLSVVRDCAEAHGGYAQVVVRGHRDSVFHVHIPRRNGRA